MKKLIIFFILLFYSNSFYSQLNYNNLIKIANAKTENIEMFMMDNFGMKKIEDTSNGVSIDKKFISIYGNIEDTIAISISNDGKHNQNILSVVLGKNIEISSFKSQLIQNGFFYKGEFNYGNTYIGDSFVIIINHLNDSINYKITVIPKSYRD